VTAANKAIEEKFQRDFPDLAKPEYRDGVIQLAQAYRTANPKITSDELMKAVGIMARQKFGLPGVPAASPSVAAGGVQPVPAGFVPAAPAAAPSIPQPSNVNGTGGDNPFAGLGMDFD
jgi:hypothetical protein